MDTWATVDTADGGHGRECVNRDTCLGVDKVCQGRHSRHLCTYPTIPRTLFNLCDLLYLYHTLASSSTF